MATNPELVQLDIMLIGSSTKKKPDEKSIVSQLLHSIDPSGSSNKSKEYQLRYFDKVRPMQWQDGDIPLSLTFVARPYYPHTCKRPYFLQNIIVFPFALNDQASFDSAKDDCARVRSTMSYMPTLIVGLQTGPKQEIELSTEAKQFAEDHKTGYIELNPDNQDSVKELKKALTELARTTEPYIEYKQAIEENRKTAEAPSPKKCAIM